MMWRRFIYGIMKSILSFVCILYLIESIGKSMIHTIAGIFGIFLWVYILYKSIKTIESTL